ncbi:PREDICTED: MHC class I polypeptide-related sequence B-like [Ceratotherium simum simum]|uniref:MHC class I polypeptide-related sequence B-like n=1 Tax=Ceratotherium simum simum TaxID=73337 RepID=A0ABM1DFH7_CERSS|nr:PREDICTED: MHC class I polypeptide-related sequence B-like [Ceratotherium simum simum]
MGLVSPRDPRALRHLLLLLLLLEESRGLPPGERLGGGGDGGSLGPHTLRYDLMALSLDRPGKPQFLALGYFDDEIFLRYDGESQRAEPRGLGIKMDLGAETWERETKDLKEKEQQLRQMLTEIMGVQAQASGQDFLTFDSETLPWMVATPSALRIKKFWETQGPRADLVKTFLRVTCPAQLWRYLASWRGLLENRDPPSVTVTCSKNLVGQVILRCWAFSFYPRGATLTWLRDGEPMHHGTFGPGTNLPSGDGTYQTWVDTQILPGEEQRFACHVGHCGLNTTVPAVSEEIFLMGDFTPLAIISPQLGIVTLLPADDLAAGD